MLFELWCWRRLLRVPWTARRYNQSILKEISPGCSLEGLMLKLKLQYFGHLIWRADSFEMTLRLGKIEGRRRRDNRGWDGWMASLTQWTWVWVNSGSWWWTGKPDVLWFMGSQRVGHDWATELNWMNDIFKISNLNWALLSWDKCILIKKHYLNSDAGFVFLTLCVCVRVYMDYVWFLVPCMNYLACLGTDWWKIDWFHLETP